jgi:hypothetical protein
LSREKFVRDKPRVNVALVAGVFAVAFALAAGHTYLFPDSIMPASQLLFSGTISLRNPSVHIARVLVNGAAYGVLAALAASIVMKGRKILQI